jgi:hypothetical protein
VTDEEPPAGEAGSRSEDAPEPQPVK